MSWTDLWKTHPTKIQICSNSGFELDPSISSPEIGLARALEITISKKYWMSFQEISLCYAPENWDFAKIFGGIFQDLAIRGKGSSTFIPLDHPLSTWLTETKLISFLDKIYEFIDNVLKLGIQYVKDRIAQDDQFAFEKIES